MKKIQRRRRKKWHRGGDREKKTFLARIPILDTIAHEYVAFVFIMNGMTANPSQTNKTK